MNFTFCYLMWMWKTKTRKTKSIKRIMCICFHPNVILTKEKTTLFYLGLDWADKSFSKGQNSFSNQLPEDTTLSYPLSHKLKIQPSIAKLSWGTVFLSLEFKHKLMLNLATKWWGKIIPVKVLLYCTYHHSHDAM